MNGDPYRTPQPADRRVINRAGAAPVTASSAAHRQVEEPRSLQDEAPRSASRSSNTAHNASSEKKSRKGLVWTIVLVVILAVVGVGGWMVWSNTKNGPTGIDSSRYQAVFLSNGQIYFGRLSAFNDETFKITKVYYPEAQTTDDKSSDTTTSAQGSSIKLIPVTDGVHGPDDEMMITKSQILYYENLKADSQVAKLIEQNKQ